MFHRRWPKIDPCGTKSPSDVQGNHKKGATGVQGIGVASTVVVAGVIFCVIIAVVSAFFSQRAAVFRKNRGYPRYCYSY